MGNRTNRPSILSEYQIAFPQPKKKVLKNGMEVFSVRGEGSKIIRIDLIWQGGRSTEPLKALARSSMQSLYDGTPSLSSDEIMELFDFYGASVGHNSRMEVLTSSLSFLIKDIDKVVPPFLDSIFNLKINEELFKHRQERFAERLKSELVKNNVVAYRVFTEKLFGENHIYGYNTEPEDYLILEAKDITSYLEDHLTSDCKVVICGDIEDELLDKLTLYLESVRSTKSNRVDQYQVNPIKAQKEIVIEGPQSHQVSIRLGRKLFDRNHEDKDALMLACHILGGYFGSRLMTNIREEKGYCYHIESSLDCMKYDGYLSIAAEVNASNTQECINEVEKELKEMMTENVPELELERVKQYIRGQLLLDSDGVFASTNILRKYLAIGLDESEFYKKIAIINKISANDIRRVAKKYFNPVEFLKVIVGDVSKITSS